ncbi:hypothetical protein X566_23130 [Afipia sp. P52-10]|nr:hypothetical protein X566_23130 [Afipia sp. P52-10]
MQLFYKAKSPREKDERDLVAALPVPREPQRIWLCEAIAVAYGRDNPWLKQLGRAGEG